jgi:hypothetical protein
MLHLDNPVPNNPFDGDNSFVTSISPVFAMILDDVLGQRAIDETGVSIGRELEDLSRPSSGPRRLTRPSPT